MMTPEAKATPSRAMVYVPAVVAVLVTMMFVTTVVVAAGTVYSTVPTVVDAAPRKSAFGKLAIDYSKHLIHSHDRRNFKIA